MFWAILSFGIIPLLMVAGVFLLYRGLTYRIGGSPHCHKCDFNLSGGPTTRCPRCLTSIPIHKMKFGERKPRRQWIRAGKILVTTAGVLCLPVLAETNRRLQFEWYHLRPTFLVLRNLTGGPLANRAAKEIESRCRLKDLTTDQTRRAIEILLPDDSAASDHPRRSLAAINCIAELFKANLLSPVEAERFFTMIDCTQFQYLPTEDLNGGTLIMTEGAPLPREWAPLRQIELIQCDSKNISMTIFDDYHIPEATAGGFRPVEIPVPVKSEQSLVLRITTTWNDFVSEPFQKEYQQADTAQQGVIVRRLKHLNSFQMRAYQQEIAFGELRQGYSKTIHATPRSSIHTTAPATKPENIEEQPTTQKGSRK